MQRIVFNAGGIVDWAEYTLIVVFILSIIAYCVRKIVSACVQIKLIERLRNDKLLVFPMLAAIVFYLAGASLFAFLFFTVIIREPVHAVRVDAKSIFLDRRWRWQSIAIPRADIARVASWEKRSPRRTYKVMAIYTPAKVYEIDPQEVGHDSAIDDIVQCLKN